jgi:hypothetical protein
LAPQVLPLLQSLLAQHWLQVPLQQCWPEVQQCAAAEPEQ